MPAQEIAVIKGTVSTPNDAERNYSESVAKRISRWLADLNLAHKILNDETVSLSTLKGVSVIILGYNPKLPEKELTVLRNFISRGGKLVVFFSSDPDLAGLLNMKLGNYVSAETGGRWNVIHFTDQAPSHLPPTVRQESHNIRPAYPLPGKSKIIAFWEDASGTVTTEPAWVQSDNGFWMSHILLDDGDTENKKQMLLAIIAHCAPSCWFSTACHYLLESSVLPGYQDFPETVKGITARALNSPAELKARSALDRASALYLELKQMLDNKQYPQIIRKCRALNALLAEAYACIQPVAPDKFRGLWEQTGLGLYPGDWNRTCKLVADNGFTDIMPNLLLAGIAHYDSKVIPTSNSFRLYGDQLSKCAEAAHKNGLRIHVWKGCWRLDYAPEEFVQRMKKENRLMISDNGKTANWLCPSNPDNLRQEKDTIREILQKYQIDGIHLDFIRFKDSHTCFCTGCKSRFENDIGKKISKWPLPPGKTETRKEFNRWRRAQITRLVRDVRAMTQTLNIKVKVSAAVYANYPGVSESIAQDWGSWLEENLVDFVCPMDYVQSNEQFSTIVKRQLNLPMAAGRVYPGIGVTTSESRLSQVQTMDQLVIAGKEGASGFALFDLNRVLAFEVLPLLRLSCTASR
ncbi:MAG: family 10 glycosylhydrolase [Kiritimatiellae bacterium]|nr:family 10 glycosylhydrolase [Kiritimatiellia bacterium]MDD5523040.1 family 10 glycosylhydrolase [Kiritimatiellia bacterium]